MKRLIRYSFFQLSSRSKINLEKKILGRNSEKNEANKEKDELNFENIMKKDIDLKDNLYLQILSSLSKIREEGLNYDDQAEKLKQILKGKNLKINDENIFKMIKLPENDHGEEDLKKIIEEDLSEEEFAQENQIRFRRPPHSPGELKSVLQESERIYQENKNLFFENNDITKEEYKESFMSKIPKYFTLRKLIYPPTGTEIMFCGVKRASNLHSLFLSKVIDKIEPEAILIQLPPDLPMFIETENDYRTEWKDFIRKCDDKKFILNPLPKHLSEIMINQKSIKKLFEKTFKNSDSISVSSKIIYSVQKTLVSEEFFGDAFLTPLVHSYFTSLNNFCPVYMCDYPMLRQIECLAVQLPLSQLKDLFRLYLKEMTKNNFDFHPEFIVPQLFLDTRLKYTTEVIRQACYGKKKIMIVSDYRYTDKILEYWKNLSPNVSNLKDFYPYFPSYEEENFKLDVDDVTSKDNFNLNFRLKQDNMSFVDFIEKLVIIDFLSENFIKDNFIDMKSFPFTGKYTHAWMSGFCNLFHLWEHFLKLYKEQMEGLFVHEKEYLEYLRMFNIHEEDIKLERIIGRKLRVDPNLYSDKIEMDEKENPVMDEEMKKYASNAELFPGLEPDAIKIEKKNPFKRINKKL